MTRPALPHPVAAALATLLSSALLALTAGASKQTVLPKTPEERSTIEELRYRAGTSERDLEDRFLRNLARDCENLAYGPGDVDLVVRRVLETYPPALALRFLGRRGAGVCLRNFVEAGESLKGRYPREVAAIAARRASAIKAAPLGDHWTLARLLELLGGDCGAVSSKAFRSAYCKHRSDGLKQIDGIRANVNPFAGISSDGLSPSESESRNLAGVLSTLHKSFERACPRPPEPEPACGPPPR